MGFGIIDYEPGEPCKIIAIDPPDMPGAEPPEVRCHTACEGDF